MKIAVASGKGGTGKTTVATNLAYVASRNGQSVAYLDCDVEEPNGPIFLKPEITHGEPVGTLIPHVDEEKCTLCGHGPWARWRQRHGGRDGQSSRTRWRTRRRHGPGARLRRRYALADSHGQDEQGP
jgi:hypothetical protein